MNSSVAGKNISELEIQCISHFGIWILVHGKEFFMSYDDFPWFKDAKVRQILNAEFTPSGTLHWPELDIDLSLEILEAPKRFPLIAKQ